jgi:hypothetical protein
MEILYPKDYTIPEKVEASGDKKKLKTFIKNLVKTEPKTFSELVDAVDQNYVETADETMHFKSEEVREVMQAIEEEYRPTVEEVVIEK